jgi:hypothetical protein
VSTNYFKPTLYSPPKVMDNKAQSIDVPAIKAVDTSTPAYQKYGALTSGVNYAQRKQIMDQLAQTGNTSVYQNFLKNLGSRRDTARAALMGYGGISFKGDDPSTPQDESLEIKQETGLAGTKERAAAQGATAAGAATGLRGRARQLMVGAALQRVSNEARAVINQYATDVNSMSDQFKQRQDELIGRWNTLYGSDANDALQEQLRQEAAKKAQEEAAARAAEEARKAEAAKYGKHGVARGGAPAANQRLWSGFAPPKASTLNNAFGVGKWRVGQSWKVKNGKRRKFYVVVPK